MFDDLIKQKSYKKKRKYYICIGCDRVLPVNTPCPHCTDVEKKYKKHKQKKLFKDDKK